MGFTFRVTLIAITAMPGGLLLAADDAAAPAPSAAQLEFFEAKVRPVLIERCYKCHSGEVAEPKGGLRLDRRDLLLKGGDSGPAIEVGDPDASYLIEAIGYENVDVQMPPKSKLPPEEIAALKTWIRDGAAWPAEALKQTTADAKTFNLEERKANHWCWQPVRASLPPTVRSPSWVVDPLDQFVLAKLETAGLSPAPAAQRHAWLRRVSFDLIGLPPTPDEVTKFENDTSPNAYDAVIDRLLASPQFGERWGRHWLDLVCYAETFGRQYDYPIADAWQYRDYVIRALNADLPYDQFVTEQIAGDLLPQPRLEPTQGTNESVLGTGFWVFNEQSEAPVDILRHQAERLDYQTDIFGKTFLGLTLACARCHDHKFDAISTKDVYSLWGFFNSSRKQRAMLDPHGEIAKAADQLRQIREEGNDLLGGESSDNANRTAASAVKSDTQKADETVFETFDGGNFANWIPTGEAFGNRPTSEREWDTFSLKPQFAQPGIAHSGMQGLRQTGVLRSKTFTITGDHVWYRVAGKAAEVRLIIENFTMNQFRNVLFTGLIFKVDDDEFQWLAHAKDLRKYIGKRAFIELLDEGDGYLAVDEIVFSNSNDPPKPSRKKKRRQPTFDQAVTDKLAQLSSRFRDIDLATPPTVFAPALVDGNGLDQLVYVRGNHKTPGELAPRRFLEAIAGSQQPTLDDSGSGRLELAKRVTDPKNPLTPRVIVNRLWHHLFGRGIVATTDNFGVLGERPTHPELLDFLADRFIREGWSIKRAIREIVRSNTYRMGTLETAAAHEKDPRNLLWNHMPVRRLQGEAIRDSMLLVSGRLDRTQFGAPVPIHLTTFMAGRGRPRTSGPLDGNGRRSIYLEVRRNFLNPMLVAFDMPLPIVATGARTNSNVPAQALVLMNNPYVVEEASRWASNTLKDKGRTPEERIEQMYRTAFSRPPRAEEVTAGTAFIATQAEKYGVAGEDRLQDPKAWKDFAHVLFNCKEFIYIE